MAKSTPLLGCQIKPGKMCLPCSEAYLLDERIRKARRALKRLEVKRQSMDSVLNEHHDPFIHRLPSEIASYIFQLCCPAGHFAVFDRNYNSIQEQEALAYRKSLSNPLVLGAVCRVWRTIAFSTPNLWNTIDISTQSPLLGYYLPLVREWLDRSAALPMNIKVHVYVKTEADFLFPQIVNVIRLLNEYSSRWLALDIALPSNLLGTFRSAGNTTLDRLYVSAYPIDGAEAQPFDLGTLPSPSVLSIRSSSLDQMKFDYSNLVKFLCWEVSVKKLIRIANAGRLKTLLVLYKVAEDPQDNPPPVSSTAFLHMQKLYLQNHPPAVWDLLKMPSLNNLAVSDEEQVHPNLCWPKVQKFVQRSQCHLTSLTVGGESDNNSYHGIFDLLCLLPELERLEVQHPQLPEAFFQHMSDTARLDTPKISDGACSNLFLPRLRSFIYNSIRSVTWWWILLLVPLPITDSGGKYRPLTYLIFSIGWNTAEVQKRLDGDTLESILEAKSRGIEIEINSIEDGDIVALSVQELEGRNQETAA